MTDRIDADQAAALERDIRADERARIATAAADPVDMHIAADGYPSFGIRPARGIAAAVLDALEENAYVIIPVALLDQQMRAERADERARIEADIKALYDRTYGPPLLAPVLDIVRGDDDST